MGSKDWEETQSSLPAGALQMFCTSTYKLMDLRCALYYVYVLPQLKSGCGEQKLVAAKGDQGPVLLAALHLGYLSI